MGRFTDWFFGPEFSDGSQGGMDSPESRSETPGPSDPSTALDIPQRNSLERVVAEGEALGLIGVYRAASIISTSLMQMSLDAYRNNEKIDRPTFLAKPDVDISRSAFLEQTAMSLILNGNAFWRVFRDNQGRVTGARVLNPLDVVVEVDSNGNVTGYKDGKNSTPLTKAQVKHLSLMRVPGDPRGRGPIQAAQAELRGVLDVTAMSSTWFQEAGVPSGILSSEQPLNPEQAKLLSDQWKSTQGGTRGTAVLGNGYTYSRVYLSPEEAMWIESRQFDTTAIARLFGVPANLMLAAVEGSSLTYSNIQQSWVEFSRFTLSRYVLEIEEAFSSLLPRGTEVKFNLEALLRPDISTRFILHGQAITANFMSVNEIREIENMPPVPGGDWPTEEELAEQKAQAFKDAQAAPGPGDTTQPEEDTNE